MKPYWLTHATREYLRKRRLQKESEQITRELEQLRAAAYIDDDIKAVMVLQMLRKIRSKNSLSRSPSQNALQFDRLTALFSRPREFLFPTANL
jgi:hypothetical protein